MTKIVGLLICWGLFVAPCAMAQTQTLTPTFWKQRLFFIPYQVQSSGKLLDPIAKVQLLTSRTGANDWTTLEEAEPNVQGFSYHAPEDGEYWFALRHLDRRGQPWPNAEVQPQMRIVVDTTQPELTLEGSHDASGEIVIRYEARDANLQAKSLILEVRGLGSQWSPLRLGAPDIAQPNRFVGRIRWRPPAGATSVEIRGAIADRAGQRAQADTKVSLRRTHYPEGGPTLGSPLAKSNNFSSRTSIAGPKLSGSGPNPQLQTAKLPSQDWPASNRLPQASARAALASQQRSSQQAPPSSHPYNTSDQAWPARTSATLVGDGLANSSRSSESVPQGQTLRITPLGPEDHAPPLVKSTPWPSQKSSTPSPWTSAAQDVNKAARVVNSRTFDVEYDLQSVGPWGVSKVELWGTRNSGENWQSYGVDPDNRSPIRVTVPEAGTFGFRILVDGANSAGAAPPRSGDEPELNVSVDLQPPTTELLAAELGQGNLADHLLVRWTAADTNLEPRPIALFYSSYPNGPWSMIASGLENTGSYTWRIERHVPGRFYLRLEARDTAGNVSTFQTPSPIALARPQPTGTLRNVRPVTD